MVKQLYCNKDVNKTKQDNDLSYAISQNKTQRKSNLKPGQTVLKEERKVIKGMPKPMQKGVP